MRLRVDKGEVGAMMGPALGQRPVWFVGSMVVMLALAQPAGPSNWPWPAGVERTSSSDREEGSKPLIHVAVLGRSTDDKASVTSALTGRLAGTGATRAVSPREVSTFTEERARGISIRRSLVTYETRDRRYVHVQAPAGIDDVKLLITGAGMAEGALLVASAAEDLDPRTLGVLRSVNVTRVVVFLVPRDATDVDGVEPRVRRLLSQHGYPGDSVPVIRGASSKAARAEHDASIDALLRAMSRSIPPPARAEEQPFLLPVEGDIFSIAGRGAVVTGRIVRGVVKPGDDVEIVGMRKETRATKVVGVAMSEKPLDEGRPGDKVGVLLRGITKEVVERGQVLARPGSIRPCTTFRAAVYFLTAAEGGRRVPIPRGYRPQFYFRTVDVTGTATQPSDVRSMGPGDYGALTVDLVTPVALERELRFAIREGGKTMGAGVVTEVLTCGT